MRAHVGRRAFFTGAATALAAAPFIPLPARAGGATYPKRLVFVFTPNGTVMDQFWPSADFEFGAILQPLLPFKARLNVMRGVDMNTAQVAPVPKDHWPDFMNALIARQALINPDETGRVAGISIDRHIAQALGGVTPYESLHLGARTGYPNSRVSANGPDQPIAPQNVPAAAFASLFADLDLDPLGLAKLRAERRSVLDAVHHEVAAIECQTRGEDREKLQAHLNALQDLEHIVETSGGGGAACAAPQIDDVPDEDGAFPDIVTQQFRITQMALACDLTRVMTIQLSQSSSGLTHPWLGIDNSHHGIAHGSEGVTASEEQRRDWLIQIETWYAERFAELLVLLDAIPEGDGSMLDHSLVLWMHEQSNGATHQRTDMPYVLAGGLHGTVETGRRIDGGGASHNGLLIALANLMDVPTTSFGDSSFSNGPLPDLWS